jgi:hypothetical protein
VLTGFIKLQFRENQNGHAPKNSAAQLWNSLDGTVISMSLPSLHRVLGHSIPYRLAFANSEAQQLVVEQGITTYGKLPKVFWVAGSTASKQETWRIISTVTAITVHHNPVVCLTS